MEPDSIIVGTHFGIARTPNGVSAMYALRNGLDRTQPYFLATAFAWLKTALDGGPP